RSKLGLEHRDESALGLAIAVVISHLDDLPKGTQVVDVPALELIEAKVSCHPRRTVALSAAHIGVETGLKVERAQGAHLDPARFVHFEPQDIEAAGLVSHIRLFRTHPAPILQRALSSHSIFLNSSAFPRRTFPRRWGGPLRVARKWSGSKTDAPRQELRPADHCSAS